MHVKRLSCRALCSPFGYGSQRFLGWNKKCHIIIISKTGLRGLVVTMPLGLCEEYVQYLGLTASGLRHSAHMLHCALWQQTPPGQVLIAWPFISITWAVDLVTSSLNHTPHILPHSTILYAVYITIMYTFSFCVFVVWLSATKWILSYNNPYSLGLLHSNWGKRLNLIVLTQCQRSGCEDYGYIIGRYLARTKPNMSRTVCVLRYTL